MLEILQLKYSKLLATFGVGVDRNRLKILADQIT